MVKAKTKGGRPVVLGVRFSAEEAWLVGETAKLLGRSQSQLLRMCALASFRFDPLKLARFIAPSEEK